MERLSLAFTKNLERVLSGDEPNVRPVSVGLPDGGKADVVLKVLRPVIDDRLVVLALARDQRSRRVVGERHVQMRGTFDWLRWHTHVSAFCHGFEYVDGKFTSLEFDAAKDPSTQLTGASEELRSEPTDVDGRAARLGIRIVRSLLHSPPAHDALAPGHSEAFSQARAMMLGEGHQNRLLVDPVLQLALTQRIAEAA